MKRKRFGEGQIIGILKNAEVSGTVRSACQRRNVLERKLRASSARLRPMVLLALPAAVLACGGKVAPIDVSFSAITYNVYFKSEDDTATLDSLVDLAADLLCLQEVTPRFERAFTQRLGPSYPYRHFESRQGTWGVALASRQPLKDVRVFRQLPHRMPALEATLRLPERDVRVACLHFFPPFAGRKPGAGWLATWRDNARLRVQQAEAIASRYPQQSEPLLVLGDLNEGSWGSAFKVLEKAGFESACNARSASCGGTWPGATSSWPAIFQVDHVLGRNLRFLYAGVEKRGGSDHYPLHVGFQIMDRVGSR